MRYLLSITMLAAGLLAVGAFADTAFDPGQDAVAKVFAGSPGMIVRVPVDKNGENTMAAEFRLVEPGKDVKADDQLPGAWEAAKDVSGFATLTKPQAKDVSAGVSTCGRWGCGCSYYYSPAVYYGSSWYSYYEPVYYYYPYSSYSYNYSYSYAYYYYPSRSYYSSCNYYPSYYGYNGHDWYYSREYSRHHYSHWDGDDDWGYYRSSYYRHDYGYERGYDRGYSRGWGWRY